MPIPADYEERVYAGVLGKIIGVYLGRPFEQWKKADIQARWGTIDRYVHEDRDVPLVVADDDISGTFTFVRILEDSGLYADTPAALYGDNWLNYIVPFKTILWWGGTGVSTEHTAFVRLTAGCPAPESGSIARNGRIVAEQIGAQIFIDAFGMVAPGKPELAAELARKAGAVSHDGEAVHAAVVVAGMVSAAFVEKDLHKLLDIGVGLIPPDSLVAQLHRDVRAWYDEDRDWEKTFERIDAKYGYDVYGGNCHVLPNHALMVLAWHAAPNDFKRAQEIVNTAGWDTDCNAANVGSVMGLALGLEGINKHYDFQSPMADRLILPTAEGTRCASDCLIEARHIARVGRKIMGWQEPAAPKAGAWHHFSLPGSRHGYMSEDDDFATRGAARIENVAHAGGRALRIDVEGLNAARCARVSTPVGIRPTKMGYTLMGTPRLYSGMRALLRGHCMEGGHGGLSACLFARHYEAATQQPSGMIYGTDQPLNPGSSFELELTIPNTAGWPICDLGIEINGDDYSAGALLVDSVDYSGQPHYDLPGNALPRDADNQVLGWIVDADEQPFFPVNNSQDWQSLARNVGRGHLVTGTLDWRDYRFDSDLMIHCADKAGLLIRYQGLRRYLALAKTQDSLQLIRVCYEEEVLDEFACSWDSDEPHALTLEASGSSVTAYLDGTKVLAGDAGELDSGGFGYLVETGNLAFQNCRAG